MRAIRQRIAGFSVKTKLFVVIVLLSLVPLLIVSFSSQYFLVRSGATQAATLSAQLVGFLAGDMNRYLEDLNRSLDALAIDSEFQKFLRTPLGDTQAQAASAIYFRPTLQHLLVSRKEVLGVLYLDAQNKVYSESYQQYIDMDYPFRDDPLFREITSMREAGMTGLHGMEYTTNYRGEAFSFVKPVYNLIDKSVGAWLILDIKAEKIREWMDPSRLGGNGRFFLYQPDTGRTVFPSAEEPPGAALLDRVLAGIHSMREGEYLLRHEGRAHQIAVSPIPQGGWSLVSLTSLDEVHKGVEHSRRTAAFIALLCFIAAVMFAYPFMGVVLKPLYLLKKAMQMLGRGTSVPVEQRTNDEIGFLIGTYNRMLTDLAELRHEVIRTKLREKEKELLQLQAQINPHFLFNTLESIEAYSLQNDGESVSDMLQCLSRMMRSNVRRDGGWTTLGEELEYIRDFLRIHQYRHGKPVNAVLDVPPELERIRVMRLSIQPFFENALKYGWSPTMDDFHLHLSVRREGKRIRIVVSNNGSGIREPVLQALRRLLDSKGETDDPFFKDHTGTWNVYRRFALAYEGEFGMEISPGEGGRGAVFSVTIPEQAAERAG